MSSVLVRAEEAVFSWAGQPLCSGAVARRDSCRSHPADQAQSFPGNRAAAGEVRWHGSGLAGLGWRHLSVQQQRLCPMAHWPGCEAAAGFVSNGRSRGAGSVPGPSDTRASSIANFLQASALISSQWVGNQRSARDFPAGCPSSRPAASGSIHPAVHHRQGLDLLSRGCLRSGGSHP